jgi:hypothetical protein
MELEASLPSSTVIELVLLMGTGRSISDDHWEEIDAAHIDVWEKAKSLFHVREYKNDTSTIRIELDWGPVLVRLRQRFQTMSRIFDPAVKNKELIRFPQRSIRVKCNVTVTREKRTKMQPVHDALHYTESFLHDVFLILNLAAPGCCSFARATLRPRQGYAPWLRGAELSLSDYPFDNAYMGHYWEKWPAPKILELEMVAQWYLAVRSGINQIPDNRAQKVLFRTDAHLQD